MSRLICLIIYIFLRAPKNSWTFSTYTSNFGKFELQHKKNENMKNPEFASTTFGPDVKLNNTEQVKNEAR